MHKPNHEAAKRSPMSKLPSFCTPKTTQTLICLVTVSLIKVNQAQSRKQHMSSWEFIFSSEYVTPKPGRGLKRPFPCWCKMPQVSAKRCEALPGKWPPGRHREPSLVPTLPTCRDVTKS